MMADGEGNKPWFGRTRRMVSHIIGFRQIRQMAEGTPSLLQGVGQGVREAITRPPRWASMDELEQAWGIDDGNRARVMRSLAVEIVLFLILMGVGLWQVLRWLDGSVGLSALMGGMIFLLGVVRVLVAAWRLDVLRHRRPLNFVQWLTGRT